VFARLIEIGARKRPNATEANRLDTIDAPFSLMTKSSIEGFFAWQIGILARMMDIQSAGRLELGTAIGITN
jgi:hypothetical protein